MLVVFLPGEDLINAEKQTRPVQWRGCCGVSTVAHWTHPSVGRKRSCGKKSKQEPWTGLFNPALNPRPYLPTTSHYLCTTFSPHTAERARTRSIVWGCLDGVEGEQQGRQRAVHGGVKRMKTTMFTGQLQKGMDAGWSVQPQSTGRENMMLQHRGHKDFFYAVKIHRVTGCFSEKVTVLYAHFISFELRMKRVHRR